MQSLFNKFKSRASKAALAAALAFSLCAAPSIAAPPPPPPDAAADMPQTLQMLELLRGITAGAQPSVTFLPQEKAEASIASLRRAMGMDANSLAPMIEVYRALGVLPASFNIKTSIAKIEKENARSMYIPGKGAIYIARNAPTPGWNTPLVKKTMKTLGVTDTQFLLTREAAAAMLDQNFDIASLLAPSAENTDRTLASRALVLGDIVMQQTDYLLRDVGAKSFALQEPTSIIAHFIPLISLTGKKTLLELPAAFREQFVFPYIKGYGFALHTRSGGGLPLLDAAYKSPPISTEQILHPEKYFSQRDIPIDIQIPPLDSILGEDWKLVCKDVLGELGIKMMLDAKLDDQPRAERAAAGWGGDRTVAYKNAKTKQMMVAIYTTWDTPADAVEFHSELNSAFKNDAAATSTIIGRDAVFIHGADAGKTAEIMRSVWESSKYPVIVPPPEAIAVSPDSPFFDQQLMLRMLDDQPEANIYSPEIWDVSGRTFTSRQNGFRITAPSDNWHFFRYALGRQIITEFTAFNKIYFGAQITLETYDKVLPGEDDPIDDMGTFIALQMGNLKKLSDRKLKVTGLPAREVTFVGNLLVPVRVRYTEVFAPKKTYIFTCGAFPPFFDKLQDEFDSFISSIKFID